MINSLSTIFKLILIVVALTTNVSQSSSSRKHNRRVAIGPNANNPLLSLSQQRKPVESSANNSSIVNSSKHIPIISITPARSDKKSANTTPRVDHKAQFTPSIDTTNSVSTKFAKPVLQTGLQTLNEYQEGSYPLYNSTVACQILHLDRDISLTKHSLPTNRGLHEVMKSHAYSQLMNVFRLILKHMDIVQKKIDTSNSKSNLDQQSIKSVLKSKIFPGNDNILAENPLINFANKIRAWKHLFLYLFSNHLNIRFNEIAHGCQYEFLLIHIVAQNVKRYDIFAVGLQFDCANYIFRRFLQRMAVAYQEYTQLRSNVSTHQTKQSQLSIDLISYFGEVQLDSLQQYGLWIQKMFGLSLFYNATALQTERYRSKSKYRNILEINATSIHEWVLYVEKLHHDTKIKIFTPQGLFEPFNFFDDENSSVQSVPINSPNTTPSPERDRCCNFM